MKQFLPKGKHRNALFLLLMGLFFLTPLSIKAQISPSGQVKIIVPTTLSSCNKDTIALELTNLQGAKGVTYAGNTTFEVDVPGGNLVTFLTGSVSSLPAGASFVSYAANKLTLTAPLPNLGATTVIKFVVTSDCNVVSLTDLPAFTTKVTYPATYPSPVETFTSAQMNVGTAQLTIASDSGFPLNGEGSGNNRQYFGEKIWRGISITNSGYGNMSEIIVKTVNPNTLIFTRALRKDGASANNIIIALLSSAPYDANNTLRTYKLTGLALGADKTLSSGEVIRFYEQYQVLNACATYDHKIWAEYNCSAGNTSCFKPDVLNSTLVIQAGTPKLNGTLVSAEQPDGCPNKKIVYKVKNDGTGNAAPVGNAYDVDLTINLGGGLAKLTNIQLNGIAIPAANLSTTAAATSVTIKLKDLFTTDPDGAGVGFEDLDSDGFFDDLKVASETTVSFDYTIPCDLACGANLYYQFSSNNTFTDFCRTLVGVTATPLSNFGFQQVQAINQTASVDYGLFDATTAPVTKTASFGFQYKAVNMNMAAATAKLVINYSKNMEVTANTIKLNGAALTNAPVLIGTGATFGGTSAVTDNDSAWVITLTPAEITLLTDNTPDVLTYDQTRYSCNVDRQATTNRDNWQLLFQTQAGLCTDGSTPCNFDLACKKAFAYGYNQGCGTNPCYVVGAKIERINPTGFTAVNQTTPINPIDVSRSYASDTVELTQTAFITGNMVHEPVGFWANNNRRDLEFRTYFSTLYTKPASWFGSGSIWKFLPISGSKIVVRSRIPDPSNGNNLGTIGPVVFEAPLILSDFGFGWGDGATSQTNHNTHQSVIDASVKYSPGWMCANFLNVWQFKDLCPTSNLQNYWDFNISSRRALSLDETKVRDSYILNLGEALARAGWTGNTGNANYYYEVKTQWKMDETFPWNNSNSWSIYGAFIHSGDVNNRIGGTSSGNCGFYEPTHLTVTKDIVVDDAKHVYSSDCGMRACNALKFNSYQGNYFDNATGEVRVPYKLQKVEINLPSEYKINSAVTLDYHQGGAVLTSTAITASATTGAVTFTNSGGGDFPRIDDQAGNQIAWKMCYDLAKQGSAAPARYVVPVKYTLTDEFGNTVIRLDTMYINEANPELVLTPLTPTLNNADGGSCAPAYFDFRIQNNTLFDAPNVYFAAESSVGTTMVKITDHPDSTYTDPIATTDVTTYGASNLFAKIGTMKAGDIRIVRVFANTTICADNFKVYADYACAYPSPLQSVTTATRDEATATYVALAPTIASKPVANVTVNDLCANKTIEIEIKNTRNTNINKMIAAFKLPANATYVAGTAQIKHPTTAAYTAVNAAGINPISADSLILTLNSNAPFTTACGLAGADTATANTLLLKFDIAFNACPTTNVGSVLANITGENYCGTKATSRVTVPINYIGSGGTQNNYTVAGTGTAIKICAGIGQTQAIIDTIKITNVGGFGASSGVSSGKDSITVTIPIDPTHFLLTNFAVGAPFSSPTMGTDDFGNTTLRVLIPAGQAVNATVILPLTYDLTPTTANICQPATTVLCNYSKVTSPVLLECAAKSLTCGTISSAIRGTGSNTHALECCTVDLVLSKTVDSSSVSVAGRAVTFKVKVKNAGSNNATGVTAKITPTIGFTFVSATPSVSYDNGTGIWTIGTINAGDSVTLSITAKADSAGVNYCTAEVMTVDQPDANSTPDNNVAGENDMARVCVTVPVELCPGQTFTAALPSGSTGIKWYKDNVELMGQTSETLVITAIGSYKYITDQATCPVEGCCPINVIAGPCACDTTLVLADKTICKGATVDLFAQASGVKGTLTYSTNGTTWTALTSPTNVTPSVTTVYYIKDSLTVWCQDIDTMTITVKDLATANAGVTQTICVGGTVTLAGTIGGSATSSTWTAPSGTFSAASSLTSTYTPSITSGTVALTLTTDAGVCPAATDIVLIAIQPASTANAGAPQSVCAGGTVTLAGTKGGSATSSTWTAPSGTFSDATSLTSTYTPSITTGTVTLTLTTNVAGTCPAAVSTVVITISPAPTANAGTVQSVCIGGTVTLAGTVGGSATGGTWTASSGTFSNATSLTSTYTPSITSGTVTLTLTTISPAGCPAVTSTVVITVNPAPDFTLTKPVACPGTGEDVVVTGLTNAVVATTQFQINAGIFRPYPNTGIITGLTAGNYTITVKNAEGCQTTKSVTVNSMKPIICLPVTVTRAK